MNKSKPKSKTRGGNGGKSRGKGRGRGKSRGKSRGKAAPDFEEGFDTDESSLADVNLAGSEGELVDDTDDDSIVGGEVGGVDDDDEDDEVDDTVDGVVGEDGAEVDVADDNEDEDEDDEDDEDDEAEEAGDSDSGESQYDKDEPKVYTKKKKGSTCMHDYVKENEEDADDDDEVDSDDDIEFDDDDDDKSSLNVFVASKDRITKPILTKYERVRLISDRAKQLALGAKPMVKISKDGNSLNSKEIAELELKYKTLPLQIIRPLPNGKKERWKISELNL